MGYAVAGGLVLAALATALMGVGIWASYLRFLGDYVGSFDVFSVRPSVMWNLRGTLALWSGGQVDAATASLINTVALVGQVAALVAVAWIWRGRWDPDTRAFALRFALTLVLGLLFSPHLNPHDDLLLVPAGAIAYGAVRDRPEGRPLGLALVAAPFVMLALNGLTVNDPGSGPIRVPVALMIAFAVALAALLRREKPATGRVVVETA